MQDGATANIANYANNVLNYVFEDTLISCRLWPARSQDLNPYDFYLWGNLEKQSVLNLHTLHELKNNICEAITSIRASELKQVSIVLWN
jgi:hypothetical protein